MEGYSWLGISEFTAALIGIALAIYFHHRSKRIIQISYFIQCTQLLGAGKGVLPKEISIFYQDVSIANLVKFNVIFWNSGNGPIRRTDVLQDDPITIAPATTSSLLKASVLKASRPQNKIMLCAERAPNVHIYFEYLEPKDGFNLELLMTGEKSDEPTVSGTIVGMPRGFKNFKPMNRSAMAFIGIFFVFVITFIGMSVFRDVINTLNSNFVAASVAAFLSLGALFAMIWAQGSVHRQGIPPHLRT